MPTPPCLAYLLDTPDEPGAVVTYRCSRPAGHEPAADHQDPDGVTWTSTEDVTWAGDAVYPAHTGWPWDDEWSPALETPPITTTPAPVDAPDDGRAPWAQLRDDAVARVTTGPIPAQSPAEELSR